MASGRVTDRAQGRLVTAHPLGLRKGSKETLILRSQSQSHGHVPMVPKWYHSLIALSVRHGATAHWALSVRGRADERRGRCDAIAAVLMLAVGHLRRRRTIKHLDASEDAPGDGIGG